MATKVSTTQYGFCPEQGIDYEIEVNFAEFPILGTTNPGYKKMGFDCDHEGFNSCKCAGDSGADCPLYKAAEME